MSMQIRWWFAPSLSYRLITQHSELPVHRSVTESFQCIKAVLMGMSNSGTQSPLVTSHCYCTSPPAPVGWLHCGEEMEALHNEDMVSCQWRLRGKPPNPSGQEERRGVGGRTDITAWYWARAVITERIFPGPECSARDPDITAKPDYLGQSEAAHMTACGRGLKEDLNSVCETDTQHALWYRQEKRLQKWQRSVSTSED